ncbi:Undecaprenyl diphosphate synthase [Actinomycetales bacterium JB111]|nr:Undecaprenyl diphosphate synthase [Actinomycetales bacterium JB111]
MRSSGVLYSLYERRLLSEIDHASSPKHVGVILDGNRRWARSVGQEAAHGHRRGADKSRELLEWCEQTGVEVVTLWMLSTDNLNRDPKEVAELLEIIVGSVTAIAADPRWSVRLVGNLDLLPPDVAARLRAAASPSTEGLLVNIAVGYGGREEIADAVRALLRERVAEGATLAEVAESLSVDDIDRHVYTSGQPAPDLLIRASGEQRLGGFLLWQSVYSELYFCETYWPAFRRIDFLRALRDFSFRERRLGK